MSAEEKCVVEIFAAANMGDREFSNAATRIVETGSVDDLGRFVVSCERCGVGLDLDADKDEPKMRPTVVPGNQNKACLAIKYYQGDSVMDLDRSWFDLRLT
jgi:hypothetical protein